MGHLGLRIRDSDGEDMRDRTPAQDTVILKVTMHRLVHSSIHTVVAFGILARLR